MPTKSSEDPFLARLDKASASLSPKSKSDAWRSNAIASLYAYHYQQSSNPFDALSAVILAGKLRILPPNRQSP